MSARSLILSVLLVLGGCSPSSTGAPRTVVSLAHLDCSDCGLELARAMSKHPGVVRTRFDRRRSELVVQADASVDVLALAKSHARDEKYELVLGPGKGSYLPMVTVPPGLDVAFIAKDGVDVADLASHRVAGKVTVMEFGAPWCEPCRKVDEHMVAVVAKKSDVAYRKLDIGEWDTPLAKHYLSEAEALPYLVVFGKDGARIDAFGKLDLARLERAIAAGGAP
jgi:thiol-disulfide isomerase/thioredoxin